MVPQLLADSWYHRLADSFPRFSELLSALLAAVAVVGLVRGGYRRTLGRRRDRYARLERLGTNAQLSFFSSALGEPPAMRRTVDSSVTRFDEAGNPYPEPKNWIECIWIDRDYY